MTHLFHHCARPMLLAASAVAILAIAGCGDEDSDTAIAIAAPTTIAAPATIPEPDTAGDIDAFCAAGSAIDRAGSGIQSPDDAGRVFGELDPTIGKLVAAAPTDLAGDAESFASIARDAVATGDFTAFEDGTVDAIVARLSALCV